MAKSEFPGAWRLIHQNQHVRWVRKHARWHSRTPRLHGNFGILTAMIRRAIFFSVSFMVAACGKPNPQTHKADVIVTLDPSHHACVVALSKEEQGSSIPCSDVISFVKDELRVPAGATYDVRTTPQAGDAEVAGIREQLNAAGYRFVGNS